MKTAMKLVVVLSSIAGLNCGGGPLDSTPASEPESSTDQAAMVKVIAVRLNTDGTFKRVDTAVTRQEYEAGVAARAQKITDRKTGTTAKAAATAPIHDVGPGDCWESDSTWIYDVTYPQTGPVCCVVGSGSSEWVSNLCGFTYARSIYQSYDHYGYASNANESCYLSLWPNDFVNDTGCSPTIYGQ